MPKYIDADKFLQDNAYFADRDFVNPKYDDTLRDLIDGTPAADVEPKRKWISVEDELPEDYRMVLCYTPVDGYICVGFCLTYDWAGKKLTKWNIVTAMRSTKTLTKKVTHWMEIPVPPKEEKELC